MLIINVGSLVVLRLRRTAGLSVGLLVRASANASRRSAGGGRLATCFDLEYVFGPRSRAMFARKKRRRISVDDSSTRILPCIQAGIVASRGTAS